MCRRVSGGLPADTQHMLSNSAEQNWQHAQRQLGRRPLPTKKKTAKGKKSNKSVSHSTGVSKELWRLAASLEKLPASSKQAWGAKLMSYATKNGLTGVEGWCLARWGSRHLMHGDSVHLLSPKTVEQWIEWLLKAPSVFDHVPFEKELPVILVQMGQHSKIDEQNISPNVQKRIQKLLASHPQAVELEKQLLEGEELCSQTSPTQHQHDEWLLGDSLPPGLSLAELG